MVLLAFSLQHQVEKYGAYVGIASFFGLAVLSLLYFAQAREVRRLRDWAGRAPERAQELEERVVAQAEAVRRVPAPAELRNTAPRPAPAAAAPASNGSYRLKPEEIAALAFARAAGVHEPPHPPKPTPVPATAAEVGGEETAVEGPPEERGFVPAGDVAATGNGSDGVPAPATPAARRAPTAPPPPHRPAPALAGRVSAVPPPRRGSSRRSLALTIGLGVVIVVVAVFAALHFLTGGSDNTPVSTSRVPVVSAGSSGKPAQNGHKAVTPSPTTFRPTTTVAVLNGTNETGLAATTGDKLTQAGYGAANVKPGNNTDRSVTASVVMYKTGARAQGNDVAKILDIKDVRPMDDAAAAAGGGRDVVVIVGQDQFK